MNLCNLKGKSLDAYSQVVTSLADIPIKSIALILDVTSMQ